MNCPLHVSKNHADFKCIHRLGHFAFISVLILDLDRFTLILGRCHVGEYMVILGGFFRPNLPFGVRWRDHFLSFRSLGRLDSTLTMFKHQRSTIIVGEYIPEQHTFHGSKISDGEETNYIILYSFIIFSQPPDWKCWLFRGVLLTSHHTFYWKRCEQPGSNGSEVTWVKKIHMAEESQFHRMVTSCHNIHSKS